MSLSTNRHGLMWIPLVSLLCVLDAPAAAVAQEGSAGDPSQWVMKARARQGARAVT